MKTRTHKELVVSTIGLGCYGLSGAYGPPDLDAYKRTLRRGYELGVTFFDTAHAYGDGERVLGEIVRPFRDNVTLATKIAIPDDMEASLTRDAVVASCEESLRRLQVDTIDLYQVHFDDPGTPVADAIGTLEHLRAAGKIRYYGIGHLPARRTAQFLEQGDVVSVMMELSPVARTSVKTLLPLCEHYDAAALAFSVTGRGLLTGRYAPGAPPPDFAPGDIRNLDPLFQRERYASGLRVSEALRRVGARYGRTPAQIAMAWVLTQPHVLCALTGPSSIPHLEENLAAGDWTLPADELSALNAFLDKEELQLAEAQAESVRQILATSLPEIPKAAFTDLVYAVETAILLGWVAEDDVIPTFRELFALREAQERNIRPKITELQGRLRSLILERT